MLKKAVLLAAVCAAFGTAALAEDETPAPYMKVLDQDRVVQPFSVTVGELETADIYAATGEEIGDVEDVLMSADGEIVAISAEIGGFIGLGEKEVVLGLGSLVWDGERVIANMTEEQVGSPPDWD